MDSIADDSPLKLGSLQVLPAAPNKILRRGPLGLAPACPSPSAHPPTPLPPWGPVFFSGAQGPSWGLAWPPFCPQGSFSDLCLAPPSPLGSCSGLWPWRGLPVWRGPAHQAQSPRSQSSFLTELGTVCNDVYQVLVCHCH